MEYKQRLIPTGNKKLFGKYKWKHEYICSCGNIKYINKYKVDSGHTRSCGCLSKEVQIQRAKNRKYTPMSEYRKKEISEFFKKRTGSLNPAWKGGKTKLQQALRSCSKYKEWRNNIFKRDDWTCQICQKRGTYLESHHIKPFITIIRENYIKSFEEAMLCDLLWDINNGKTLCLNCHNKTKDIYLRKLKPKPLTRIKVSCLYCSKTRYVYKSYSKRPFCNRECYRLWKKGKKCAKKYISQVPIVQTML
jgi:hypothetical protein